MRFTYSFPKFFYINDLHNYLQLKHIGEKMSEVYRTFTSESVTQGHPDKVADIVSDAILDAYMAQDPNSHVACETCVTTDFCMVFGEITSNTDLSEDDIEKIIRDTIIEIGYDKPELEFDGNTVNIPVSNFEIVTLKFVK